jgi:hypothetical protein
MMAQSGQTTVANAGTEVRLAADQPCEYVYVKAKLGNTGTIYIGNHGDDTVSSTTGFELAAGDEVLLKTKNLNQWLVDSSVNGEGVTWILAEG